MTESEAIKKVDSMDIIEKAHSYKEYVLRILSNKYTSDYYKEVGREHCSIKSYEKFADKSNATVVDLGSDWKIRGFASQKIITLNPASMYHQVYHNL
jgi:hypothetical protein